LDVLPMADHGDRTQSLRLPDGPRLRGKSAVVPESRSELVGQHFVRALGGKLWPVIVCSDDVSPAEFMSGQRAREVPAIHLGSRE
jgi:hypothetical protein